MGFISSSQSIFDRPADGEASAPTAALSCFATDGRILMGSVQLVKKSFDKLVDGEARSPATATLTSLR